MFHVHLFDNVRVDGNTLGDFRTRLAAPIRLETDYAVALNEISLTTSWNNLACEGLFCFVIGRWFIGCHVERGRYTREQLIAAINSIFLERFKAFLLSDSHGEGPPAPNAVALAQDSEKITRLIPQLVHSKTNFKVQQVQNVHEDIFLAFDRNLCRLLGQDISYKPLDEELISSRKETVIGNRTYNDDLIRSIRSAASESLPTSNDIEGGVNSILVIADIVRHEKYGNTDLQLLKVVHIKSNKHPSDQQYSTYSLPEFKSVNTREIREIHVKLLDEFGRPIQMQFGRVWMTLIFKPIQDGSVLHSLD